MKSLMSLFEQVLADAGTWCRTCTIRDLKTVSERSEHEGLSFLTITLPSFGRDFERSLDQGFVSPTAFPSFKKRGCLPRFLGGFNELVFDRSSGRLLAEPDKLAIFFVRQLSLLFKKIKISCTQVRERSAFSSYRECEREVSEWSGLSNDLRLESFRSMSRSVWSSLFSAIDRKIYCGEHVPKHGPGSTADKRLGNRKFDAGDWPTRLDEFFPSSDFVIPNYGFFEELSSWNFPEPGAERPVKVISVPKTLKTPRIIAMEPVVMQYAQQSILELLVEHIEKDSRLSGCIGFTDQTPNQRLAMAGSLDKSLATIDLSEASDRVSNQLVLIMMENFPSLSGAVQACRSTRAEIPNLGVIPLSKFASMGSALCFPVMAMTILVAVCIGRQNMLSRTLTESDLRQVFRVVRIYGDDIIVPVSYVPFVVGSLEDFGLKVNVHKSFWTGMFRESCGKDYYDGSDVSVTYVRHLMPQQRHDTTEIVSTISLRNQFYKAGLWRACRHLDVIIRRLARFPNVTESSPIQGRNSFLGYKAERTSERLHRPEVLGLVVVPKPRPSILDGSGALMKYFLKRGFEPMDKGHLSHYGRPVSVDIKHRWATPY